MLGVSTMPAREALLRLGAEGFLIASPNRSFTVRRITEQDVRDIYWMHAILAGELTRRACLRGGDALMEELRECEAEFVEAWNRGDAEAMDTANWRFHREINKAAEAPKLWMLLNATLRFIPTRFYVLVPAWSDESKRGHIFDDALIQPSGQWHHGQIIDATAPSSKQEVQVAQMADFRMCLHLITLHSISPRKIIGNTQPLACHPLTLLNTMNVADRWSGNKYAK